MKIGSVVRARRIERGITQEALALELDTATSTLSRIEKDQRTPSLDLLIRLAGALDMPTSDLLRAAEQASPATAPPKVAEHGLTYQDDAARLSQLFRRLDAPNRQLALEMLKLLLHHQREGTG